MPYVKSSTYILEIIKSADNKVKIGAIGEIDFAKGTYFYVGSAKANMMRRIQRHLSKYKNIHWHIDYLLMEPDCRINYVWLSQKGECEAAQQLLATHSAIAIPGFGCSDCRCKSHLIYFKNDIDIEKFV